MLTNLLSQFFRLTLGKFLVGPVSVSPTGLSLGFRREYLLFGILFLRNSGLMGFSALVDVFGMDHLSRFGLHRFNICYVLYNRKFALSIAVQIPVQIYELVSSVSEVFRAAGWLEREIYDMFGIFFYRNGDMRRILNDYGFDGFPLRKDFPLTGFVELQYSEEEKVVITNPLRVDQALRLFHFAGVWDLQRK